MALSREKRQFSTELKMLNQKECQSRSYFKRKSHSSAASTESTSPVSSRTSTPCPISDTDITDDQIHDTSYNTSADTIVVQSGDEGCQSPF